jgi:ATP-dependent Clp protease adaptor protein ClpS
MGQWSPGTRETTLPRIKPEIAPPVRYRVLMHNDDYTTMEFVVLMLEVVFHKPADEAERIMLQVHTNGIGVCGVYTAEVAETKIAVVHRHAQDHGFPLLCTMEPE